MSMKKTAIVFLSVLLLGCNAPNKNINEDNNHPRVVRLIRSFENLHPNWGNNEVITKKLNDKFKIQLADSLKDTTFLSDVSVRLESMKETQDGKYIANFMTPYANNDNLLFNIVGYVPKESVDTLLENGYYTITGVFKGFIENGFDDYLDVRMTDIIGKKKNEEYENNNYGLGTILMDIKIINKSLKSDN